MFHNHLNNTIFKEVREVQRRLKHVFPCVVSVEKPVRQLQRLVQEV